MTGVGPRSPRARHCRPRRRRRSIGRSDSRERGSGRPTDSACGHFIASTPRAERAPSDEGSAGRSSAGPRSSSLGGRTPNVCSTVCCPKPGSARHRSSARRRAEERRRGRDAYDRAVVARLAPAGSGADPQRAAQALRTLASADLLQVPRLLRGDHAGDLLDDRDRAPRTTARSAVERTHEGDQRGAGHPPLGEGPPTSLADDLAEIGRIAVSRSARLERLVATFREPDLPAVLRHGDLWAGNLLRRLEWAHGDGGLGRLAPEGRARSRPPGTLRERRSPAREAPTRRRLGGATVARPRVL